MEEKNDEGKNCPSCAQPIGVLAVVKAPIPTRIFCPHCHERLKYTHSPWYLIGTLGCLYAALFAAIARFVAEIFPTNIYVSLVVLAVLLWQPFELLIAWRLRSSHRLVKAKAANNSLQARRL